MKLWCDILLSGTGVLLFFSCNQAALLMVQSVCPSIRPSHLFTPQPSALEGYCRFAPGVQAGSCRLIDFICSRFCGIICACSCALSWSFAHLPYMGLPMGQKLCGMHISETARWIYPNQSFMDLSRHIVVQHHSHLTLTLYFQGKISEMLYPRNGRAD